MMEKYNKEYFPSIKPAKIAYMATKDFKYDWDMIKDLEEKHIDEERYRKWRDRAINHVLGLLNLKHDFENLLPYKYKELMQLSNYEDMSLLLEVAENIWDISRNNLIGTIRRERWAYIYYSEKSGLTEKDWVLDKISKIINIPDKKTTFYHRILYVYWNKRLRSVR